MTALANDGFASPAKPADGFATPTKPSPDESGIVRDRWGRYVLPDPETGANVSWTRATTFAKTISDTFALHKWQQRMLAKGLVLRPDLIALIAATGDKEQLDRICEDAKTAAGSKIGANLGTAIHNYTEQVDLGVELRSLNLPGSVAGDIASYQQMLVTHGLRPIPELIERVIICPKLKCAGRLDRIMTNDRPFGRWDEPGALFIGDVKTAANIGYSWLEVSIQLAIYANAEFMWNIKEQRYEPMPKVDLNEAVVLHVPVEQAAATPYRVDIDAGWRFALLAAEVRKARADKTLAVRVGSPITAQSKPEPAGNGQVTELDIRARIDDAKTRDDLSKIWQYAEPRGLWTPELERYGLDKLKDLRG